ncbi:hypothetical protein FI667_g11272, partial [Globisporangium splendens]
MNFQSTPRASCPASELSLEEALAFFDGYDEHGELSGGGGGAYAPPPSSSAMSMNHMVMMQMQQQHGTSAMTMNPMGDSDVLMMDDAANAFMHGGADAMFLQAGGICSTGNNGAEGEEDADFRIDMMTASLLQPMHIGGAAREDNADATCWESTPMQALLASELPPTALETMTVKSTATADFAVSATPAAKAKKKTTIAKKAKTSVVANASTALVVPPPTKAQKPTAMTAAAAAATTSSSTKRVRRQKEELLYLRTKVVELEERLQQLKRVNGETNSSKGSPVNSNCEDADGSASPTTTAPTTSNDQSPVSSQKEKTQKDDETETEEDDDTVPAISPALLASVWENVADRQYKERLRAEQQNKKLKTMLEGQIKLATSLEKILKKRPNMEVLYPDTENKPPKAQRVITYEESDADIFKTQLEAVEKAYPDVDEVMKNTGFFTSEETRHDVRVKDFPDDDGVLMEFMATTTVPFDLHVTGNALWRFMSEVAIKRHCYFEKPVESTEDTIQRGFGLNLDEGGLKVDLRGKHTLRKYIEDDRVVIVWKSLMEPISLPSKVKGLRFHDIGYLVAQRSESNPIGSTLIKAYGNMSPVLPEETGDQDEQIGALTDFVINCHESNVALCTQLVNDLLVEEEWKATIPVIL